MRGLRKVCKNYFAFLPSIVSFCVVIIVVGNCLKAVLFCGFSRSFARIGTSFMKEKDYAAAVEQFNKSLTEHRTKDVLEKLQKCQKAITEAARLAYINPDLALEEKQKGNDLYVAGTDELASSLYIFRYSISIDAFRMSYFIEPKSIRSSLMFSYFIETKSIRSSLMLQQLFTNCLRSWLAVVVWPNIRPESRAMNS